MSLSARHIDSKEKSESASSDYNYQALNKELKESIQKEFDQAAPEDFEDVKIPPLEQYLNDTELESIVTRMLGMQENKERAAKDGADTQARVKQLETKIALQKRAYEKRCNQVKEYVKSYYLEQYV